jgi:Acetyltransferase (GNAT) domain
VKLYLTNQREEWHNYVTQLPPHLRDVHFLPEMMVPYEETRMGRGMLLVDECGGEFLIQPLLRLTNGELRHPYNFGGPIATPDYKLHSPELRGPVFCTLNPFLAEAQLGLLKWAMYRKDVVWVDLTRPVKLRQTTRHCVAKAEKAGAYLKLVSTHEAVSLFIQMYHLTMKRNAAAPHWFFPLEWFLSFVRALAENATLFLAYCNDELQAGCILLHGFGTCYYHFAASYGKDPNINHFMVAKSLEWARTKGHSKFHLGGGVQPDDGLFRFKAGFSALRAPVYQCENRGQIWATQ